MALAIPKCSDDLHLQTSQQKVDTNPKAYPVNMQVLFRYWHLPDLYHTCRIPFAHTSLVLFQYLHTIPANTFVDQYRYYRDTGTSNLPANIIWPSIVIPVPIIYHLISSGTVPFFYRDTSTCSIASGLVPFSYSDTGTHNFTDKYLLTQYHFIASTPVYI